MSIRAFLANINPFRPLSAVDVADRQAKREAKAKLKAEREAACAAAAVEYYNLQPRGVMLERSK